MEKHTQLFCLKAVLEVASKTNSSLPLPEFSKNTPKNEVIALTNHIDPPEIILEKLKNYGMTSFRKLSSSYKYCVIANGEFDIYADKVHANEWDDAAGHAIAEHAGALVTDLENNYFSYGREDYKNPTILIRRSENLNA